MLCPLQGHLCSYAGGAAGGPAVGAGAGAGGARLGPVVSACSFEARARGAVVAHLLEQHAAALGVAEGGAGAGAPGGRAHLRALRLASGAEAPPPPPRHPMLAAAPGAAAAASGARALRKRIMAAPRHAHELLPEETGDPKACALCGLAGLAFGLMCSGGCDYGECRWCVRLRTREDARPDGLVARAADQAKGAR